jgi:phosphomannomutase/phosphoglucomutase
MAKRSSFATLPMAGAGGGLVAAALLAILLVKSTVDSDHRNIMGDTMATTFAQQVDIKEADIRSQLSRLAGSKIVADAMAGSLADLTRAETTLTGIIPEAVKVKLIPQGQARTDQSFPPFTYTALDLVNRVESGQNTHAEVISSAPQLEGDKWVIAAEPISDAGGVLRGTLFVYLTPIAIGAGVNAGDAGALTITQMVGTEPRVFYQTGTGSGAEAFTHALKNPNWQIHYSPSTSISGSSPGNLFFYLIPGLTMLVICLAGIVVGNSQITGSLKADINTLQQHIADFASTREVNPGEYDLTGFSDLESELSQIVQRAAPAVPAKSKARAKPKTTAPAQTEEVVDIQMVDEPAEVEEIEVDDFDEAVAAANQSGGSTSVSEEIFRAYDIRGIVGQTLSEEIARNIGLAIGSEAGEMGEDTLLVACDGREYSPALTEALVSGITASGRDVINIGAVPTPILYYGTHNTTTTSGVIVTGSHSPADYNGFKIVLNGKTLVQEDISALYQRILENNFSSGEGIVSEIDISQDYMNAITDDVVVAQPLKVVVDCGNGIAGKIAPELFDALGCETLPLYCDVDGTFPNHPPDPTKPENLKDLVLAVQSQGADLGIALDGDGDRLLAVTHEGEIVWPDRLLMLFAKDIVSRNPGSDVVYDVKCSRHLNGVISSFGGRPVICRSGHSYIKEKINEVDALIGGELSGHICFSERWFGFDDGLYSAARLLEIVGSQAESLTDLLKEFPVSVSTPEIHISVSESDKFSLVQTLIESADFEDATITTTDGLRVDFSDGWGLVRASNTGPALTLRFEADNTESLEDIKVAFKELLQETREDLDFS